jgi:ParB family chromosome partitioning protein
MKLGNIPIDLIYKKDNVREESETELSDLAESIDRFDILQPIIVRPVGGRYEIISGHRRFLAMKMHGDETIPCVIRSDISEDERIYIQLVENTHRKQMSAMELVDTFDRLKEQTPGLTNAGIARRIGRPVAWVANQYGAAKYASNMADVTEVKNLTAGQILGRARRDGLYGMFRKNKKIKIEYRGYTVRIVCKDVAVRQEVLECLGKIFPDEKEST